MIVAVPFTCHADFVKRGKGHSRRDIHAEVVVDVREALASAMPVVASIDGEWIRAEDGILWRKAPIDDWNCQDEQARIRYLVTREIWSFTWGTEHGGVVPGDPPTRREDDEFVEPVLAHVRDWASSELVLLGEHPHSRFRIEVREDKGGKSLLGVGSPVGLGPGPGLKVVDREAWDACLGRSGENGSWRRMASASWGRPDSGLAEAAVEVARRFRSRVSLEEGAAALRECVTPVSSDVGGDAFHDDVPAPATVRRIDLLLPEAVPGMTAFNRWRTSPKRPDRRIEPLAVEISTANGTFLRRVASHPQARFAETFHDGSGFLVRAASLDGLPVREPDGFRGWDAARLGEALDAVLEDVRALGGDVGRKNVGVDPYVAAVRRPGRDPELTGADVDMRTSLAGFAARRVVEIDGGLFYRVPEPVLVVDFDSAQVPTIGVSHSWRVRSRGGDGRDAGAAFLFRLDSLDEARRFGSHRGRTPKEACGEPSVDEPGMLSPGFDAWNVRAAMLAILSTFDGRLRLMSEGELEAAARMSRFIRDWRDDAVAADAVAKAVFRPADVEAVANALSRPYLDGLAHPALLRWATAWNRSAKLLGRTAAPAMHVDDMDAIDALVGS